MSLESREHGSERTGASVGIVIPAFRPDVGRLEQYIDDLKRELAPATIRVELDDATTDVADRLADRATVNRSPKRRGKGAAITAGFHALDTDVLAFLDADGSTPAGSAEAVIAPVRRGDIPMAVGSRRHPDAEVRDEQSAARGLLGDGFAWVARSMLGIPLSDFQCGAKAIRRAVWDQAATHLSASGFGWDVELIAAVNALGYRLGEVPIEWEDAPKSTVSPIETSLELGRALLSARHKAAVIRATEPDPHRITADGGGTSDE